MSTENKDTSKALARGENKAVEYDVKLLEDYRNIATALWNSATNIPVRPQHAGLSRRDALTQPLSPKEGNTRMRPRKSHNGGQRKLSKELLKSINQLMDSIRNKPELQTQAMADLAVMIFHVRDCRKNGVGKGAHEASWSLFRHFTHFCPETALALIELYPQFGYWKDLNEIVRSLGSDKSNHANIRNRVFDLFAKQLHEDEHAIDCPKQENVRISLAGKWAPRKGKRFDRCTEASHHIAKRLYALDFPGKTPEKRHFSEPKPRIKKEDEQTSAIENRTDISLSKKMTDLVSQSEKYEMQKKSEDKHQFKSHIVSYDEMHHYTTTIARLNRYLQTPEIKMCEKKFGEIHVDKIAGKCLNRNKSIFLDLDSSGNRKHPNDDDRTKCANNMIRFIEDAKKTGKSAKGTSLNVVELVKASHESIAESPQCDLVELQWRDVENALRTEIKETGLSFGKGLVLADVSGSMTCDRSIPLYLSVGMAILVSHLAEEPWKNKFVTFEKDPEFVDISECKTLKESIDTVLRSRIGLSTDFLAAFYLILSTAVEHRLQPEQLPSFFLVVSDMQFDEARSDDLMFLQNAEDSAVGKYGKELYEVARTVQIDNLGWATHHDLLKKLFFDVGISTVGKPYLLPMMIYWNARSTGRVPVLSNEKGAQMISGYSPNLLKLFLSDGNFDNIPTPWETFRKAMDHLVYQPVRKIIERVKEHPHFIYYEAPNIDENDNKKKRRIE